MPTHKIEIVFITITDRVTVMTRCVHRPDLTMASSKVNWVSPALQPAAVTHVTWCVYALFIDNEERIKRDCKYSVTKVSGNQAISLGGYLWAVSSVRQEQLQVRCLEETHVIEIQPPLQIVYLGNGCEGYSPSMFLPAKNEMTTHAQTES